MSTHRFQKGAQSGAAPKISLYISQAPLVRTPGRSALTHPRRRSSTSQWFVWSWHSQIRNSTSSLLYMRGPSVSNSISDARSFGRRVILPRSQLKVYQGRGQEFGGEGGTEGDEVRAVLLPLRVREDIADGGQGRLNCESHVERRRSEVGGRLGRENEGPFAPVGFLFTERSQPMPCTEGVGLGR